MLRSSLLTLTTAVALAASAGTALAAAPANDALAAAQNLGSSTSVSDVAYTTVGAGHEDMEAYPGLGRTAWFKWTPAEDGGAYTDVCDATSPQLVKAYRHLGGSLVVNHLVPAADGQTSMPGSSHCRYRWRATAGTTYYLQVDALSASVAHTIDVLQDLEAPAAPKISANWPTKSAGTFKAMFSASPSVDVDHHECKLTGQTAWKACKPGDWLTIASSGIRAIGVRAVDHVGNVGDIDTHAWEVDATPPETTILTGAPTVTWKTDSPGGTHCRIDGSPWTVCDSGFPLPMGLAPGGHQFEVRAYDSVGNRETSPASVTWTIAAPAQATVPPWIADPKAATTPVTTARATSTAACVLKASAPKRIKRSVLKRKGLKVAVSGCRGAVKLSQRGKALKSARRARKGALKVTVTGGGQRRTLTVRVV